MKKAQSLFLFVVMQASLIYAVQAASKSAKLPVWTAPKSSLSRLTPPKKFSFGQIRAPKGYDLQEQQSEESRAYAWVSPPYEDGTRSYVMMGIVTPPAQELKKYSLDQLLSKFLQGVQRRRSEWQQTKAERGLINGLVFMRARWSGINEDTGLKMRGFIYVAKSGPRVIQISSQEIESQPKSALETAEASALTFAGK